MQAAKNDGAGQTSYNTSFPELAALLSHTQYQTNRSPKQLRLQAYLPAASPHIGHFDLSPLTGKIIASYSSAVEILYFYSFGDPEDGIDLSPPGIQPFFQ